MIIPAKFQPSSSTGKGGKWGDRRARDLPHFPMIPTQKNQNEP